ncbi:LPS export ABC transporter periplasmic protein LptC [Microvirga sp. 2TAF3]|uniref:LPS export ABC transporter periplasmic protein LptC n=1 Tax=Microvirga sp. 2TAF3 TaxID=3233014 RepID=UPI003F9B9393
MAMRSGSASRSASRLRDFSKARRHSRWVRLAKVAIPLGSVLAMGIVGLVAYIDPFRSIKGLSVEAIGVNGTQVTMESPKLTGFRNDSRPYEVTASQATQDVRKPNFVELKDLRARIVTDEKGSVARLEAAIGVLDTQKEQMNLRQEVRVHTDAGQQVNLRSAFVDFKAGRVVSDEPVTVSLGNGLIEATGLEVTENGKVMHFRGRVRTTFENAASDSSNPPSVSPAAGPPARPAQPTSFRP